MNLRFIIKAIGLLSFVTTSYAKWDSKACDDLANTFASHPDGDYNDLSQCRVNENGEVDYIIVGYCNNERAAQHYINEVSKLSEVKTICLYDVVSEGLDYAPLKKLSNTLERLLIDYYKGEPLKTFPEAFLGITSLKLLSIESNNITSIPDDIKNLKNLENLYLEYSPITKIPKSIGKLSKLKKLVIIETKVTNFPKEIGNLKNLETLDLHNGLIDDELPESLNDLKNLKVIDISGNKNIRGKTLTIDLEECNYGSEYDLCITERTTCLQRNRDYKLCSGVDDDPLKLTTDGTCGDEKFTKCPEGQCCSKYGWCGTSEKHCSVELGCQTEFGNCTSPKISEDKRCGKDHGDTRCPNNQCCSKYGWCGKTDNHCDISSGCQSEFGRCNGNETPVPVGTKGKCGKEYGKCREGECCSRYGWCGKGDQYCGAGCQSEFGTCL